MSSHSLSVKRAGVEQLKGTIFVLAGVIGSALSGRFAVLANLPEINTIGTPTPGVPRAGEDDVFAPQIPGPEGSCLSERVACGERCASMAIPWACQSAGVVSCSTVMPSPNPT